MSVLWICASTCFRFWSKPHTKLYTNNSLLSRDKTTSFLLELIDRVLSISEHVLEKHLLSIFIKNLHKALHKELCNSTCQKTFSHCAFAVGQRFSISAYDLENGRMLCKQKYWIKKYFDFGPLLLLCWLGPVSIVAANCFDYIEPCR